MFARVAVAALLLGSCAAAPAPEAPSAPPTARWADACEDWADWDKPGPPFLIHGQTYYVGTCGIAAILVVGPEGHTLIDGGTEAGADLIAANIRALGFDPADVDTLLTSHEHHDHVGGIARLQQLTGAALVTSAAAAPVLRGGTADPADPQAGLHEPLAPANVDHVLEMRGGESRILAAGEFRAIATPGHTPGALTWQWRSCDGGEPCRTIVYADSLSPVSRDGYRFSDHPEYLRAYRAGIARVAALECDILLTPHPSASGLRERLLAGDSTRGMNCRDYAESIAARLDARLAEEANGG